MRKKRYPKDLDPSVVIKVTVTNGQAGINLPKKTALKINLINEDGEPGKIRHLLVTNRRNRIGLYPVEMTEVEAK
ncbi:unnamed protein product [marine sediment metagenome]|uniref:Uncharacterized protein n=1 Tax=marine sediment metagenome TaxID=412755 RepID=X1B482_9ZZZZ